VGFGYLYETKGKENDKDFFSVCYSAVNGFHANQYKSGNRERDPVIVRTEVVWHDILNKQWRSKCQK